MYMPSPFYKNQGNCDFWKRAVSVVVTKVTNRWGAISLVKRGRINDINQEYLGGERGSGKDSD